MKIAQVQKAEVRKITGVTRKTQKDDAARADRVLLSGAAVRHLEVRAKNPPAQDRRVQESCRKIAARIRAGDHVPPEDRRYLEEHDATGYQLAMAMRHVKERPRHWDSAIKDAPEAHKPSADGVAAVLAPQGRRSDDPRRRSSAPPKEEEEG